MAQTTTPTAVNDATMQQYILLPPRGMSKEKICPSTLKTRKFLSSLEGARLSASPVMALKSARTAPTMRVLDSIHENGAKLVEMTPASLAALRAEQPGLRIATVVYYYPAVAPRQTLAITRKAVRVVRTMRLQVVSQTDGKPIAGVAVIAFTDFANGIGAQGGTNSQGLADLSFDTMPSKIERLYVYPERGFWSALQTNVAVTAAMQVRLQKIDLSWLDGVRHFYGQAPDNAGQGLKIGVIDTGIGPHPDLVVEGGVNTVLGEDANDYGDNGIGHGTHVAGIIAARGRPPNGMRGVAPGVTLRSYRVFGKGGQGASNFAIAKAIDCAVNDGCDLINMSLGNGPPDEVTHSAMAHARASGTLVFAANGNDSHKPVSFPAADSLALAVSALGRKGTYPTGTTEVGDESKPFGTDKGNFIAAFSNVGPETDLTAPGVGIISTFPSTSPDKEYAVLDGTSMACPAATAAAARLLANQSALIAKPRNQERSDVMAAAVLQAAQDLGFSSTMQGNGLPAP